MSESDVAAAENLMAQDSPKEVAAKQRAARKVHPKITMGNVAPILGMHKYRKRSDVIREMVRQYHNMPSEYVANAPAEYADRYRAAAEAAFEAKLGKALIKCDLKKPHKFLTMHPTMVHSDKYPGPGLVFIRLPFHKRDIAHRSEFDSLDDQAHMAIQMQVEMALAGCTWGVFFQWSVLCTKHELVQLDQGQVDRAMADLERFYAEYKDETKNKDHLEAPRKSLDSEHVQKLMAELDELQLVIDNHTSRKEEILDEFKALAKDKSVFICGRRFTRSESSGSVQYSKIVKEHLPSLDLEKYRGAPSVSWKLEK
ncbi:hypothetical protein DDSR119_30 [Pseudomonas phage DDSR119]|nr:hypothetical protein DDSR119_30 [Pseudomonas phage DDSR119]